MLYDGFNEKESKIVNENDKANKRKKKMKLNSTLGLF